MSKLNYVAEVVLENGTTRLVQIDARDSAEAAELANYEIEGDVDYVKVYKLEDTFNRVVKFERV